MIELPDALDLYWFFEVDPDESDEFGHLVTYTVTNKDGLRLTFSCNLTLASVGVQLELHEREIISVYGEYVSSVRLRKDKSGHSLVIQCDKGDASFEAQIWVKSEIKVRWSTL